MQYNTVRKIVFLFQVTNLKTLTYRTKGVLLGVFSVGRSPKGCILISLEDGVGDVRIYSRTHD